MMTTIAEAWAAALGHHQAGRSAEAEQLCRQIIAVAPSFAGAWHLLALLAGRSGNRAAAIECLRHVIQLRPDFAEAHNNLGAALHGQGALAEACECYRRALELKPGMAEARSNLGSALQALGQLDEAIVCFRAAIVQMPNQAELHNNLGDALQKRGQLAEAIAAYRKAIELNPSLAEAYNNLGTALKEQEQFADAEKCYRRAVELRPAYAEAQSNLATALKEDGKLEEAVASYRRAVALMPDFAEAQHGLGTALRELGEIDEALICYDRAIALKPDFAEAHFSRACVKLLKGDFAAGWKEYQWRWKTKQLVAWNFSQPLWDGGSLVGKTILLHAEQGLGDTLQFVRYAPLVKRLGAKVIFECQRGLMKLIASCAGLDQLIGAGDELPAFDVHAPLLTLPAIFGTTLETIPANVPYLFADPVLVEHWRERLADIQGLRIGINWQGRAGRGAFRRRDIPVECFQRLAELPGVRLISLQKRSEVQSPRSKVGDRPEIVDLGQIDEENGAFMDTAAIMMNLDLVITSDTSVAHVAGSLGLPVWVLLPKVAEWRWLLGGYNCPWYPTMRLFRQAIAGDWGALCDEVRETLSERVFGQK
jgi:tetratricopeptide (TPR) repeat protein